MIFCFYRITHLNYPDLNISVVTEHSLWWLLLFLLVSAGIVYWQYFFRKPYREDLSKLKVVILASLRFGALFSLLFLLLNPKIKYKSQIIHKPLLIFAQDVSASIGLGKDSAYYKNEYGEQMNRFLSRMTDKYDVRKLSFGEQVKQLDSFEFTGQSTDFSELLQFLDDNYSFQKSSIQILLASDGLYNAGGNPRYMLQNANYPIHTIQLGDTATLRDAAILSVRSNKIGFVGNNMPVRIGIKADNLKNENLLLTIKDGNTTLVSDQININNNSFFTEKDYQIQPVKAGLKTLKVNINSNTQEHTLINNNKTLVVDVLDSKRKIAICYDRIHPDISALKNALEENKSYTCELYPLNKKMPDFDDINLIILHQISGDRNEQLEILKNVKEKSIPALMIIGAQTKLESLNSLNLGVKFNRNDFIFQNAVYKQNENFSLFDFTLAKKDVLGNLPPLLSPFSDFDFEWNHQILAYQKIKDVETDLPLIAFTNNAKQKIAWIFGEGIWRWKLALFKENDSHVEYNELINRITQYLALKVKRNQLLVDYNREYIEGREILIGAELYNKSYQLNNNSDLEFVLTDEKKNKFSYEFDKRFQDYQLKINGLKLGRYKFEVLVKDSELKYTGEFLVNNSNIESASIQAKTETLMQISKLTGGEYFENLDENDLGKYLVSKKDARASITENLEYGAANNFIYLLISIIIFMVLEWFLRKYWLGN